MLTLLAQIHGLAIPNLNVKSHYWSLKKVLSPCIQNLSVLRFNETWKNTRKVSWRAPTSIFRAAFRRPNRKIFRRTISSNSLAPRVFLLHLGRGEPIAENALGRPNPIILVLEPHPNPKFLGSQFLGVRPPSPDKKANSLFGGVRGFPSTKRIYNSNSF